MVFNVVESLDRYNFFFIFYRNVFRFSFDFEYILFDYCFEDFKILSFFFLDEIIFLCLFCNYIWVERFFFLLFYKISKSLCG